MERTSLITPEKLSTSGSFKLTNRLTSIDTYTCSLPRKETKRLEQSADKTCSQKFLKKAGLKKMEYSSFPPNSSRRKRETFETRNACRSQPLLPRNKARQLQWDSFRDAVGNHSHFPSRSCGTARLRGKHIRGGGGMARCMHPYVSLSTRDHASAHIQTAKSGEERGLVRRAHSSQPTVSLRVNGATHETLYKPPKESLDLELATYGDVRS